MSDGDEEYDIDRRTLLQTGAATVSLAALAGCPSGGGGDGGDGGGGGDGTEEGTGTGTGTGTEETTEDGDGGPNQIQQIALENFPYAPGEIDDLDHYDVKFVNGSEVSSAESDLSSSLYDTLKGRQSTLRSLVGANFSDTPTMLNFRTTEVLRGGVSESDAISSLDGDDGYEQQDSAVAGFTVYVNDDDSRAVGVRGETVVSSTGTSSESDASDVLETVLNTAKGTDSGGTRYVDDDSSFQTLMSNLSGDEVYQGGTHSETGSDSLEAGKFAGETARGIGATFDGGTASVDWEFVFASSDDVSSSDFSTWTGTDAFSDYSNTSTSTSDTSATVEADISTSNFAFTYPAAGGALLDYVPAPDEVYSYASHMYFTRINPTSVDDSDMSSFTIEDWKERGGGPLGILATQEDLDLTRFSTVISASDSSFSEEPIAAATGDYTQSDVVSDLEDSDLSQEDSYSGFTIYNGNVSAGYYSENEISVGVSSDIVVAASDVDSFSTSESDPTDLLEIVIDAGTGDADRYVDDNDDFQSLMTDMQGSDIQDGNTQSASSYGNPSFGTFQNTVARGTTFDNVTESDSDFTEYIYFEEESDVDMDDIDTYIQDSLESAYGRDYSNLTSSQDGRKVTVTGTIETSTI